MANRKKVGRPKCVECGREMWQHFHPRTKHLCCRMFDSVCPNAFCRRPLRATVLRGGETVFEPCEYCARLERGLCYACNKPLDPAVDVYKHRCSVDGTPSRCRWHIATCYKRRHKAVKHAGNRAYHRRHRKREQQRHAAVYAAERKAVSHYNKVARLVRTRNYTTARTRPCPYCPGTITYYSKPAKACDACWAKVARGELTLPKEKHRPRVTVVEDAA